MKKIYLFLMMFSSILIVQEPSASHIQPQRGTTQSAQARAVSVRANQQDTDRIGKDNLLVNAHLACGEIGFRRASEIISNCTRQNYTTGEFFDCQGRYRCFDPGFRVGETRARQRQNSRDCEASMVLDASQRCERGNSSAILTAVTYRFQNYTTGRFVDCRASFFCD